MSFTTHTIIVEITLHDENTNVDQILDDIADIDGVDVVVSDGIVHKETYSNILDR